MCVIFFIYNGDSMNEKYMSIALKEAKKAFKYDDVPVGCIIVKNNKIISKAFNKKENKKDAVKHAEIEAISKACKKLKTWHLEECILYTTMEPCMMCSGAIIQSRIGHVCYAIKNDSFGMSEYIKKYNKNVIIEDNVLNEKSLELIQLFFKKKRM